jgi:predicted dehydrogenase
MKFLIEGIGSIGQRHYKNLVSLGHEVAILRSSNNIRPFVKDFFESQEKIGKPVQAFYDLDTAINEFAPNALVVANPNHLHFSSALKAAQKGLHIFIDKPVSHTQKGLDRLKKLVSRKKLVVMVGYNLRFHPLLFAMKRMVELREIGNVISAQIEVGENIVDWHPWEDYRDTYAPYIKSGGGSLLCFSHDIDYLYWILGMPQKIFSAGGKVTPLAGDAEDLVQALFKFKKGVTATMHIDYFQRPKVRTFKIIGTKKTLVWDAYKSLTVYDHESGNTDTINPPQGFDRNVMFIDEMKHFVRCIEKKQKPLIPINEGEDVLMIVDGIKKALKK